MRNDYDLTEWARVNGMPLDNIVQRKRARALMRFEVEQAGKTSWDDWPDTRPYEALMALDAAGLSRYRERSEVAGLIALRAVDDARDAAVATLTGSALNARVAAPRAGVAPLLTAGRSVRGPGLSG